MLADVTTGSIYDSGAAVPVRAWGGVCGDFKNGFQNFQNFNKKSIVKNEFLPALFIDNDDNICVRVSGTDCKRPKPHNIAHLVHGRNILCSSIQANMLDRHTCSLNLW